MTCPKCRQTFQINKRGRPKTYCSRKCQTTCRKQGCKTQQWREKLCWSHYRQKLDMEPSWNLADRIADMLNVDGEWWTLQALADRFGAHPDSITRSVRQLERDGYVKRRQVWLATTKNGKGYDQRVEWRAA